MNNQASTPAVAPEVMTLVNRWKTRSLAAITGRVPEDVALETAQNAIASMNAKTLKKLLKGIPAHANVTRQLRDKNAEIKRLNAVIEQMQNGWSFAQRTFLDETATTQNMLVARQAFLQASEEEQEAALGRLQDAIAMEIGARDFSALVTPGVDGPSRLDARAALVLDAMLNAGDDDEDVEDFEDDEDED